MFAANDSTLLGANPPSKYIYNWNMLSVHYRDHTIPCNCITKGKTPTNLCINLCSTPLFTFIDPREYLIHTVYTCKFLVRISEGSSVQLGRSCTTGFIILEDSNQRSPPFITTSSSIDSHHSSIYLSLLYIMFGHTTIYMYMYTSSQCLYVFMHITKNAW